MYDLINDQWAYIAQPKRYKREKKQQTKPSTAKPNRAYNELLDTVRRLLVAVQKYRDLEPREIQSMNDKLNHMIDEIKN